MKFWLRTAFASALGASLVLVALATWSATDRPELAGAGRKALGQTEAQKLPPIAGRLLEGSPITTEAIAGRRLVLFFFDPGTLLPAELAPVLASLEPLRPSHNFELLGVSMGVDPKAARRFADRHGITFPILNDARGTLATTFQVAGGAAVIAADAEGTVVAARRSFGAGGPPSAAWLRAALRDGLRLPLGEAAPESDLLARPEAPDFERPRIDEAGSLQLSALRGRAVVLVFFVHHCPHCHAALRSLREELAAIASEQRPRLVGVETSGKTRPILASLDEAGIEPFPIVADKDQSLRDAYGVFGVVPVTVLIDAEGRIAYRSKPGWDPARDPDVLGTRIARLAGVPGPMRLPETGYAGSELCGGCHELEYATWSITPHASAFDTLVTHGADRREECVGCHVVGFGEPGGYALAQSLGANHSDLEDVGCEACHGAGGPHRSPGFVPEGSYGEVCVGCHDTKHSLGFVFDEFHPRISHTQIASLSGAERAERYGEGKRKNPLPEQGEFVGSEVCATCHPAEHATWSASAHARAFETLEQKGKADDPACLTCHTTGFDRGGLAKDAAPAAHSELASVGCESCHGKGSAHVAPDAPRRGTILALRDKCESCVILQICGACHDDANDPGFAFEVQQKIDRQRHGTIGAASPAD